MSNLDERYGMPLKGCSKGQNALDKAELLGIESCRAVKASLASEILQGLKGKLFLPVLTTDSFLN